MEIFVLVKCIADIRDELSDYTKVAYGISTLRYLCREHVLLLDVSATQKFLVTSGCYGNSRSTECKTQ
jgi:hypothetical protein